MYGSITGVFFDFGGTLFDFHPTNTAVWAQIAQRLGADVTMFDPRIREGLRRQAAAHLRLGKPFHKLSRTQLHELNCQVLDALGIDCEGTMDVVTEEFEKREARIKTGDAFRIMFDCWETLERINYMKAEIRLGLISNCSAEMCEPIRSLLKRNAIYRFFDAIILSGEVGVEKPDKAIFEIALKELGREDPHTVIHVGDSMIADVQGAQNAGLIPILYDPLELHSTDDIITLKPRLYRPISSMGRGERPSSLNSPITTQAKAHTPPNSTPQKILS